MKQKCIELKVEIDKSTIIFADVKYFSLSN